MLSLEDYYILLRLGADFKDPKERGGTDGKKQKRQDSEQRRKDRNYYKKNKSKIKRRSKKHYERVCKKNKKCMKSREEYRKNPDKYKRRRAGDIILYDQEAPNKEVKQPEQNVSYRGVSPTHFVFSPDDKEGLPKGNDLPNRHLDDVPAGTSRVVPNGQYVKSARFRRKAMTEENILRGTNPRILSDSRGVGTRLRSQDENLETYTASGTSEDYTVRIQEDASGIKVSCTCPFFRWQGPEHWAQKEGYLLGRPVGTASKPTLKDPKGENRICKHVASVLLS